MTFAHSRAVFHCRDAVSSIYSHQLFLALILLQLFVVEYQVVTDISVSASWLTTLLISLEMKPVSCYSRSIFLQSLVGKIARDSATTHEVSKHPCTHVMDPNEKQEPTPSNCVLRTTDSHLPLRYNFREIVLKNKSNLSCPKD